MAINIHDYSLQGKREDLVTDLAKHGSHNQKTHAGGKGGGGSVDQQGVFDAGAQLSDLRQSVGSLPASTETAVAAMYLKGAHNGHVGVRESIAKGDIPKAKQQAAQVRVNMDKAAASLSGSSDFKVAAAGARAQTSASLYSDFMTEAFEG
jgi:hypothetical protein